MNSIDSNPAAIPQVRFSLTTKLFLLVLVSFCLLLTFIIFQVNTEAEKVANAAIEKSIRGSESIFDTRLASQFKSIEETVGNLARDGRLLPLIYDEEAATLQDQCSEFKKSLNFDILIFTNAQGIILARSDDVDAIGQEVLQSPLFQSALTGKPAQGIMKSKGELYQIVVVPVVDNAARDIIRGSIALAYQLAGSMAEEIKMLSSSEIAFFAMSPSLGNLPPESPVEIYNTLPGNQMGLATFLENNPDLWTSLYRDVSAREIDIDLKGETFHALLKPLLTSSGEPIGFAVSYRSRTELLRPFKTIERRVFVIGLICIIFTSFMAYGIARHISGPIIGLVVVTKGIQEGNYPEPPTIKRNDEVGILNQAIYQMGRELKEKAELENYLAGIAEEMEVLDPQAKTIAATDSTTMQPDSTMALKIKNQAAPGAVIDRRYQIVRTIGAGAMGIVYLAADIELEEQVALKILLNPDLKGQTLEQFKQEIRLARKITHRNVLRTYDFGAYEGFNYITMEYFQGSDLSKIITKNGALDLKMGIMLARQMCSAIAMAHAEGIVHRDLKPQNMMINRRGILKIMDFGIAINITQTKPDAESPDTAYNRNAMVGTPNYMSPEQFSGVDVDLRTDIYSLGVILFLMFTGKLPFTGKTLWELSQKVINEPPPTLKSLRPDAPDKLEAIIARALAKDRTNRYANITEVLNDFTAL